MLVLINGMSTSGKSTIAKELSSRGFISIDIEHSGHAAYYNKQTGAKVAEFGHAPERTQEWLNAHQWLIDIEWVKSLQPVAKGKTIFLCGGGSNEKEVSQLCDVIFWLSIDEDTVRRRVQNTRDHDYGTKPHELKRIIENIHIKQQEFVALGAELIDATKPINEVIEAILVSIHQRNNILE